MDEVIAEISHYPGTAISFQSISMPLKCRIRLWFTPIPTHEPAGFVLNGDVEVAIANRGWVVPDAIDNIPRCIEDKTRKVLRKNRVEDYSEWWLVLVDHILLTPSPQTEQNKVRAALQDRAFWSRIVVANRWDPGCFLEL